MIEIPGRIPIAIHPFFWVCAGLIGWLNSSSLMGTLIWIGIIFVSVLFHEFGHALTAVAFRQKAQIQLVALGGLTSYDGPKLKFWQQFIIVLNGPLFGIILFIAAGLLLRLDWSQSPVLFTILKITEIANLIWSVVNLFPVLPLDGGQLLRIVLEAMWGVKGYKASLLVGGILSTLVALGCFLLQGYLAGALFFLFAFQSYDLWRKSRAAAPQDRDDSMRHLITEAEEALQQGRKADAEKIFSTIRETAKEGILYNTASQYLAFLEMQAGHKEQAYQLLLPIEEHLADESKVLLHELAAQHQNWEHVAKLATEAYQLAPSQAMAINNARAFAFLHQPKPAGGWLQTAYIAGGLNLEKVLKEVEFQDINQDPDFQHFVKNLK